MNMLQEISPLQSIEAPAKDVPPQFIRHQKNAQQG